MKRRLLPHPGWFAASIILLLSALVPTAYVVMPHVDRWLSLRPLTGQDMEKRQRAVNYVARHGADDPRVLHYAVSHLDVADSANFMQIRMALDVAGQWKRKTVGDDAYLRWLSILADDVAEQSRISATQALAQLSDLADDDRPVALLGKLIVDPQADVRFNALAAAAELSGAAGDAQKYVDLIGVGIDDAETAIARHAWIMLGLLDPARGFEANWRSTPPPVGAAILWACLATNPTDPSPAIEALRDPTVDSTVRAMAAYALVASDSSAAVDALLDVVEMEPAQINQENIIIVWRAILSLPRPDLTRKSLGRLEETVSAWAGDPQQAMFEPLVAAATYQLGIGGIGPRPYGDPFATMIELATVEAQAPPWMFWPIIGPTPQLLRVMTTAVSSAPQPEDIRDVLAGDAATLRDLACVVAAKRFTRQQNEQLIISLLRDYDDDAKMSGAILAGLTGLKSQLLRERIEAEDIWQVGQVMRAGLWMTGELPQFNAAALLEHDELPVSTLLLAMLHRGGEARIAALDYLLNPRGEPTLDLVELFDKLRWWYVLRDYLPADAPPFWWWADAQLEAFQIDVLRDWYLINRHQRFITADERR